MHKILLIDDDVDLSDRLTRYFERFDLKLCSNELPSEAIQRLRNESIDLVILDVMLPEMDGFEVCREIRKSSDIPVIMLTARGEVMDRIVGLEMGADDYLPKPFEPRELVARIKSILKRVAAPVSPISAELITFEDLYIDTELRQVYCLQQLVTLSSMEYQLLCLLVSKPGKVYSRDDILNSLKGIDADVYSRSVDILVSRLRAKLKPLSVIKTIRSAGYCFVGKAQ